MLQHLDDLLYQLFASRLTTLNGPGGGAATPEQIRFQAPDAAWRTHVGSLGTQNALNVYLVEMRENRRLRSTDSVRTVDPTTRLASDQPAPARINCHYLITAWSNASEDPAAATAAGTGTAEEHAILYEVTALLMASQPLVSADVYAPAPVPASFPELLADASLPIEILPVEGFHKYAEFWGTMGNPHAKWKPAVYLIVTVPVKMPPIATGFIVTTRMTWYRVADDPQTAHLITQIGGRVTAPTSGSAPPQPVSDAWVRLEQLTGEPVQSATTDSLGQFTFADVAWGDYTLRVRAGAHPEKIVTPVPVPATSIDGYDVVLS